MVPRLVTPLSISLGRGVFYWERNKCMKRILVLVIALLLSGCAIKEPQSLQDELLYDNRIVVGVSPDYPPFQYLNNKGEVVGFEVDLFKELVNIINRNHGLELEVEYRQMAFEMLISSIHTRQVDVGSSGFTYSPDRDGVFSHTFFNSEQIVIVDKDSDIKSIEDLEGKRIGANLGSTGEEAVKGIPGVKITNSEYTIMFTALKSNSLDAVVSDLEVGNQFMKELDLTRLDEPLLVEENKLLFRHDLKYLEDAFNEAIDEFINSPSYQELLEKWGLE